MDRNNKGQFVKGVTKSPAWYAAMAKRSGPNHKMWKGGQKVEIISCGCGCGKTMNKYGPNNRTHVRINGHQMVGRRQSAYHKWRMSGPNNPRWVHDRSKVKLDTERGGPLHKQWSKNVKDRDGWTCKIANNDCSGRVIAHHILSWRDYIELRYEVNNGITLCHAHHPRKRNDEIKFAPLYQNILGVDIAH